ncbi:hypothetical protein SK128_019936, partial [Halocaridina rubra]
KKELDGFPSEYLREQQSAGLNLHKQQCSQFKTSKCISKLSQKFRTQHQALACWCQEIIFPSNDAQD